MRNSLAVLVTAAAVASGLALAAPAQAAPTPVAAAASAPIQAAAVPPRNDSLNEPIYWVHGIMRENPPSANCAGTWNAAIGRYRALGARGPQHTVAYYTKDRSCNTRIGNFGNRAGNLDDIGKALAWDIYNRYTRRNISVDAVGHSMGGLIIRAAITGVQKKLRGWPPRLYVEDVVTFSTPHTGAGFARLCGGQCVDMRPGSAFLKWLSKNPQSTQGTDWTLLGAGDDDLVSWQSAVSNNPKAAGGMSAGHKVVFISKQGLEHGVIHKKTSGAYKSRYWNFYQNRWIVQNRGASPVVVARNASFFWRLW
ncbi:hypothetical protein JIG36_31710 [Actinoplanes sp. LDG1-06]|uniref:DUF676 domain-containing protein n=1 Tax=Paractinoplanes ovalisporus TaxID=2810368 RepID=A0ABS2AJY9_9ACTN|nr:hypothetical protein [Actinoplanes ovalisporus]MBM2620090.1 hypothetical protein [Actinoplanes ovalisporus]